MHISLFFTNDLVIRHHDILSRSLQLASLGNKIKTESAIERRTCACHLCPTVVCTLDKIKLNVRLDKNRLKTEIMRKKFVFCVVFKIGFSKSLKHNMVKCNFT